MEVLVTTRQAGKTTMVLNSFIMDPDNSIIVTFNEVRAQQLRGELARIYDVNHSRAWLDFHVRSCFKMEHFKGLPHHTRILIDDADGVLQMLFGENIKLVTFTALLHPMSREKEGV